jgi:hypothetical protein
MLFAKVDYMKMCILFVIKEVNYAENESIKLTTYDLL